MSAWLGGGQPKLCRASLNMSLVQTQASLMFFKRNIWWNPMMGSSSACEEKENASVSEPKNRKVVQGLGSRTNNADFGIRSYCLGLNFQYSPRILENMN